MEYESKQDQKAQAEIASGEFMAVVLLMVLKTSLNSALLKYAKNGHDLKKALADAVAEGRDQKAEKAYQDLIDSKRFKPLFDLMLTDDNIDAVAKIGVAAFHAFNRISARPWGSPPHPRGGDVAALLAYLASFTEKEIG